MFIFYKYFKPHFVKCTPPHKFMFKLYDIILEINNNKKEKKIHY